MKFASITPYDQLLMINSLEWNFTCTLFINIWPHWLMITNQHRSQFKWMHSCCLHLLPICDCCVVIDLLMNLIDKNVNETRTSRWNSFHRQNRKQIHRLFGGESSSPYLFRKPNETMNETEQKKGHKKTTTKIPNNKERIIHIYNNNCRI